MSCITKLLEIKGDKEILAVNDRVVIEGGGNYKNYEYLIVFTSSGHRCGYVAIPEEVKIDSDNIDCHGGITFESKDHDAKDLLPIPCNDTWIGFDAAHFNDDPCHATARKYFGNEYSGFPTRKGSTHKTYNFMKKECQHIIDQLVEKQETVVNI